MRKVLLRGKPYFKVSDVAKATLLDRSTVTRAIQGGALKAHRVPSNRWNAKGGPCDYRILGVDFDKWWWGIGDK